MNKSTYQFEEAPSAGNALRHQLFNKITPILLGCDHIDDSQLRLMIQACCLDMVTMIEDVIRSYGLDGSEQKSLPATE
jgi:hypothetical protein